MAFRPELCLIDAFDPLPIGPMGFGKIGPKNKTLRFFILRIEAIYMA
jgi:hypothetical protein